MSYIEEFRGSTDRFKDRIKELQTLLQEFQIKEIGQFINAIRENAAFRTRWNEIWTKVVRDEGGKITLGTVGAILGAVFGGVGIAAFGTAIGIPGLIVFGFLGLLGGTEWDSNKRKRMEKEKKY
jgi:hypothetical protein